MFGKNVLCSPQDVSDMVKMPCSFGFGFLGGYY